jgi:uncharacterized membrane protein
MHKHEFLNILDKSLHALSETDRRDILSDYEEHFAIGILRGRSEEEIALALGDPKVLGREYCAISLVKRAEEKPSVGGIGRAVIATIGLGFFNLIVVLIPLVVLIALLAALLLFGFFLFCFGIIMFGYSFLEIFGLIPLNLPLSPIASIFFGVASVCLGLFIILGEYWLIRIMYHLGIRYLKWNIAVIHGNDSL